MVEGLRECEAYMKRIYPDKYKDKKIVIVKNKCEWIDITKSKESIGKPVEEHKKKVKKPNNIKNKTKKKVKNKRTSKAMRKQILKRDNYKCIKCGNRKELHVRHILYRSIGGGNDKGNLITLCEDCHIDMHKNELVYNLMKKRRDKKIENPNIN